MNSVFPWLQQKDVARKFSIDGKRTLLFIPKEYCPIIHKQLEHLGVNIFTAYPDIDHLKLYLENEFLWKMEHD